MTVIPRAGPPDSASTQELGAKLAATSAMGMSEVNF